MEHEVTEAFLGILGLSHGVLFILVGWIFYRTHTKTEVSIPALAFTIWWYTAGVFLMIQGTIEITNVLWRPDLPLHVTAREVQIFLGCIALFSLSHYFTYLYLGTHRMWIFYGIFYALSWMFLLYLINFQRPAGLNIRFGQVDVVYEDELPVFGLVIRMMTLLFIPPALGLLSYALLFRRVPTMLQKTRIFTIFIIITHLFFKTILIQILQVEIFAGIRMAIRIVGIVAIAFLWMTYQPPAVLQRRLEVETW